jgi:four helix bundle protein
MPTVEKFEDIRSWQTARELTRLVYPITTGESFQPDPGLRDQVRRAAGSCMHHIAEDFRGTDAEFMRCLGIARRSTAEVQSQLYVALDQPYLSQEDFETLYNLANQTKKQINAFIANLAKRSPKRSRLLSEPRADNSPNFSDHSDYLDH